MAEKWTEQAAAAKGAAWLDERLPGWWWQRKQIKLINLDMNSTCFCVLGQLAGTYWHVVKDLWGDSENKPDWLIEKITHRRACLLGFDIPDDESATYRGLKAAWSSEIKKRRQRVEQEASDAR